MLYLKGVGHGSLPAFISPGPPRANHRECPRCTFVRVWERLCLDRGYNIQFSCRKQLSQKPLCHRNHFSISQLRRILLLQRGNLDTHSYSSYLLLPRVLRMPANVHSEQGSEILLYLQHVYTQIPLFGRSETPNWYSCSKSCCFDSDSGKHCCGTSA